VILHSFPAGFKLFLRLGCHRLETTPLEGEHETSAVMIPLLVIKESNNPQTKNKNNNKKFPLTTTLKKDKEKD